MLLFEKIPKNVNTFSELDIIFHITIEKSIQEDSKMENAQIGEKGKSVNLSNASRAMNKKPDGEQIKKFDESAKQTSKFRNKLIFTLLVIVGFSGYLFFTGHWIFASILAVISLLLLLFTLNINSETVYENGLIIPAIIVNTNPLKIIVLADMRSEEEQTLIWGCQKITLKNLPNHKIEIGEKIPCVSLFGMAINGYRRHFEPRPISWGFKNPDYLSQAVELITNNECPNFTSEWEILEKLSNAMKDFDKENEVVFFDEDLNRVENFKDNED